MKRAILRRLPACIGLVGAVFLLSLAVPRSISSITYELTTPVFENRDNPNITQKQLHNTADDLLRALSWVDNPVTWSRLGYIYAAIGRRQETIPQQLEYFYQAEEAFTNAVKGSPSDPYYWLRLTYTRLLTGGAQDGSAADALKMSLLTGPYEKTLAIDQIYYATSVWDQLDDDQKKSVNDKVRWIAKTNFHALVKKAKSNSPTMQLAITALAEGDIQVFKQFILALNKP